MQPKVRLILRSLQLRAKGIIEWKVKWDPKKVWMIERGRYIPALAENRTQIFGNSN